ncbi:MAG: hypothetical protein V4530_07025 [Pseudomonadota bacterium]
MTGPFELATKFLLRLLLPGAVLAAAFMPLILELRNALGIRLDPLALFSVGMFALGWLLILLDMPIYMAFEGRRYWPNWLRRAGIALEQRRMNKLQQRAEAARAAGDGAQQLEYRLQVSQFPMTQPGLYEAWYPTRLGNVLAGFEQYPSLKYGLDGVFFWYRLWVAIGKDLREDLDNAQALVDGALYAVVAFLTGSILCAGYAAFSHWAPGELAAADHVSSGTWLGVSLACLVISVILYRACVNAQVQYGELFKALFDQHRGLLAFDPLLDDLERHNADLSLGGKPERERNRAAWRFLRWHRYRPDGSNANTIVKDW